MAEAYRAQWSTPPGRGRCRAPKLEHRIRESRECALQVQAYSRQITRHALAQATQSTVLVTRGGAEHPCPPRTDSCHHPAIPHRARSTVNHAEKAPKAR